MSSHSDAIDDRDLATLRNVRELYSRADPVPADLAERVKFEITVQALHAEVAELMDSALLVTRGDSTSPTSTPTDSVTFAAASVSLMVTLTTDDANERVRIDGYVTTPGAQVDAVTPEGTTSVISDAHGRFVLDDLPHGPVHFVILTDPHDSAAGAVVTPIIQL